MMAPSTARTGRESAHRLTLRTIYKLPLRQTQGLMRSIARLMGVDIPVPDFSTLSRRGLGLRLPAKPRVDRTDADPSDHGQYWIEDLWRGRVAAGQA